MHSGCPFRASARNSTMERTCFGTTAELLMTYRLTPAFSSSATSRSMLASQYISAP